MNLATGKVVFKVLGRVTTKLIGIGTLGVLNQYTNQQFRNKSNDLIGEVERGVEHQARKMNMLSDD